MIEVYLTSLLLYVLLPITSSHPPSSPLPCPSLSILCPSSPLNYPSSIPTHVIRSGIYYTHLYAPLPFYTQLLSTSTLLYSSIISSTHLFSPLPIYSIFYPSILSSTHIFINSLHGLIIYIASLQGYYSEALPTLARLKGTVLTFKFSLPYPSILSSTDLFSPLFIYSLL